MEVLKLLSFTIIVSNIKSTEFILRNYFKIIVITSLTVKGIRKLPEIPYLSAAARSIDLWQFSKYIYPQTIFDFALIKSISIRNSIWSVSQGIGQQ